MTKEQLAAWAVLCAILSMAFGFGYLMGLLAQENIMIRTKWFMRRNHEWTPEQIKRFVQGAWVD